MGKTISLTPVACKGEHGNAVHLRTFGSRYHRTNNPPSGDESYPVLWTTGLSRNTGRAFSASIRMMYGVNLRFKSLTINVLNPVR
ncbi:hypothetical protein [Xenorhabdus lircayensis]|uniref:Uncharacterized protein n=1 Tax=Xenorhabdus lircayensis TaxID=2763499 RepID=A0ABS0U0Z7_9GAMM|nr:hypothetical protein [Xenorhabdus lircayensis]MBI6547558.1 hypothetical protein [Xenorhabdus lircayensis]